MAGDDLDKILHSVLCALGTAAATSAGFQLSLPATRLYMNESVTVMGGDLDNLDDLCKYPCYEGGKVYVERGRLI